MKLRKIILLCFVAIVTLTGCNSVEESEKAIELFGKHSVYTPIELHSRAEIEYETYSKTINIEAKTMIEMTNKLYIPAVIKFVGNLANSINSVKSAVSDIDVSVQEDLLKESTDLLKKTKASKDALTAYVKEASELEGASQAMYFRNTVFPGMAELRSYVDALELIVDKEAWPVPTYGDLLFEV